MTQDKVWYGVEREGKNVGQMTLFIRGGFESKVIDALRMCRDQEINIQWLYFGAGATSPGYHSLKVVLEQLMQIKPVCVEIKPNDVTRFVNGLGHLVEHWMVGIYADRCQIFNRSLSLKIISPSEKVLVIGTKYEVLNFDDTTGKYQQDVVLI